MIKLAYNPILSHDPWLRRLAEKYATPRAVLARQLSAPGALEEEIGCLISEVATARAHALFAEDADPPVGTDLFDRAVAAVYARLAADRDAQAEAARQARYAASDAEFARMKAGGGA